MWCSSPWWPKLPCSLIIYQCIYCQAQENSEGHSPCARELLSLSSSRGVTRAVLELDEEAEEHPGERPVSSWDLWAAFLHRMGGGEGLIQGFVFSAPSASQHLPGPPGSLVVWMGVVFR